MTDSQTGGRSGRLAARDWIEAAYAAVVEGGISSVAVEPLSRKLGVTRGSFYWHFRDRKALIEAVLERWERDSTEAVISATCEISDPVKRFMRLAEVAFGEAPRDDPSTFDRRTFELAVSDAADDPVVRPFLRRVTERRIGYIEECYLATGLTSEESGMRALMTYAAYAGTVRLFRDLPDRVPRGEEYLEYRRGLVETFMRGADLEGSAQK